MKRISFLAGLLIALSSSAYASDAPQCRITALAGNSFFAGTDKGSALAAGGRVGYSVSQMLAAGIYFLSTSETGDLSNYGVKDVHSRHYNFGIEGSLVFASMPGLELSAGIGAVYYPQTFVPAPSDGAGIGSLIDLSITKLALKTGVGYYAPLAGPVSIGGEGSVIFELNSTLLLNVLGGLRLGF